MTVAVIGAGLAGLMTAVELDRLGVEAVVLEASPHIGGVVRSVRQSGYLLEPGGGGFNLPHPAIDHFVDLCDIDVIQVSGAARRYLAFTDQLLELPSDPGTMATSPVLTVGGKLRALREPTISSASAAGESLLDFMVRRFGVEAGRLGAHLASAGVFAGDPAQLSVEAAFGRLLEAEARSGSILRAAIDGRRQRKPGVIRPALHLPPQGMATFVDQLAAPVRSSIRTGFGVKAVTQSPNGWIIEGSEQIEVAHVVLATSTDVAARIAPNDIAPLLADRPSTSVAVVGIGSSRAPDGFPPPGFGALAHPDAELASVGVLFESSYAPNRAPDGGYLVKVIAGGALRPEVRTWSDDYLVRVVGTELANMVGFPLDAEWTRVIRQTIPQYDLGHVRWLDNVERATRALGGFHVTGWGYRGVGIGNVASDALAVAADLAAS